MSERAITWQRVSTDAQDTDNQAAEIAAYVKAKGYQVVKAYEVEGASAFHGKQQGALDDMLTRIKDEGATVVVVWHSDRLERRGARHLLNLLDQIKDAGARVESVKEPELGAASVGGQVMTFLGGLMAHSESAHKSDRMLAKQALLRDTGSLAGGKPPFGYEIVTAASGFKTLAPTESGRRYIPQIFAQVEMGASLLDVARWLTSEGVPTVTGLETWGAGSVRQMIYNGTYAGRVTHSGVTYARCEALVSAAVLRAAQEALKARAKRPGRGTTGRAAKAPALIRGMRCGECGGTSPMYRVNGGTKPSAKPYYRCTGTGPQRKGCGLLVRLDAADATVLARLSGNTFPHMVKATVRGTNWEAEIADTALSIRELDPLAAGYSERQSALVAQLQDYQARKPTADDVRWTQVLNPDGTPQTVGQMFSALDADGKRAYIASCTITATSNGVRIVTPEREVSHA